MQKGGGGEIDTMAMVPTRHVVPPAASVYNRCELTEGVGSGVGRDGVEFKRFWTVGERLGRQV